MWQKTWKYKESFVIAFAMLFVGFLLEITTSNDVVVPSFPVNLIIILVWVFVIIITRKIPHPFFQWVKSTYAAISAITVFTLLVLFMGFIPQSENDSSKFFTIIGLNHILTSWQYLIMSVFILTVLGYTIFKRKISFKIKDIAFYLNHGGLWILIIAASFGVGDMVKLRMVVYEGDTQWTAVNSQQETIEVPFAIKLNDFDIEYFPVEILVINNNDESIIDKISISEMPSEKYNINDNSFVISEYLISAIKFNGKYHNSNHVGSAPACKIIINDTIIKWISYGSHIASPEIIKKDSFIIAMSNPAPKKFFSDIILYAPDTPAQKMTIEVNKPISINGWDIYQTSYDEKLGRWSNYSVFEVVKDAWLPAVYLGLYMVLAGAVLLFWSGKSKTNIQ